MRINVDKELQHWLKIRSWFNEGIPGIDETGLQSEIQDVSMGLFESNRTLRGDVSDSNRVKIRRLREKSVAEMVIIQAEQADTDAAIVTTTDAQRNTLVNIVQSRIDVLETYLSRHITTVDTQEYPSVFLTLMEMGY